MRITFSLTIVKSKYMYVLTSKQYKNYIIPTVNCSWLYDEKCNFHKLQMKNLKMLSTPFKHLFIFLIKGALIFSIGSGIHASDCARHLVLDINLLCLLNVKTTAEDLGRRCFTPGEWRSLSGVFEPLANGSSKCA